MGMVEFTEWCIKYPWHVTKDMPVPKDCSCEYCRKARRSLSDAKPKAEESQVLNEKEV